MVRVLLVDDSIVQLQTREAVLRRAGFEVVSITTAEEALNSLRVSRSLPARHFNVVITDHMMPEVSGLSFVQRLREADPDIPVVVITGMPEAEAEYRDLNITFLKKPCPPEELIRAITDLPRS